MPVCARCGQGNPDGFRFCGACGAPLEAADGHAHDENKVVTVLFADLMGSTELGERLDPERLRFVMRSYFEAMAGEIRAEGGTVEKFIGDAVMAVFGAPVAHEDDPLRAVRAAFRMQQQLDRLNESLDTRFGIRLALRIGVNTGDVVAADEPRRDLLVSGDTVNVAARLEQVASPGEVLLGERSARVVRDHFELEERGEFALRGKSTPLRAWRPVLGTDGLPPPPLRRVRGSPFVGRRHELHLLQERLACAEAKQRAELVTVFGEPGIGKSRLLAEFLAWAAKLEPAPLVRQGRCLPYGDGVTFWPLAEILKRESGSLDSDSQDVARAKLARMGRRLFASGSDDSDRVIAALALTMGLAVTEPSPSGTSASAIRNELHAAWRTYFSSLGDAETALVLIEDLHWADPSLLDLLEDAANGIQAPVLFVCTTRPELRQSRPEWGETQKAAGTIALEPLTEAESRELAAFLVSIDDLPATTRETILARAEGNPLFLEEIVAQLIDEEMFVRENGHWRAAASIEFVTLPDTVQGVLAARIDLLGQAEKQAIQSAAVVGRIFWAGAVARLGGEDGPLSEIVLAALQERDLVSARESSSFAGEREYIFKHVLTRDVAYASLTRHRRAEAHSEIAEWIEELAGERRGEVSELLAYHFDEAYQAGEDWLEGERRDALRRRALTSYRAASERAALRAAAKQAEAFAQRAVALAVEPIERAAALETLGDAFIYSASSDEAWPTFVEAAQLFEEARETPALARVCAKAVEIPTRWMGALHGRISEAETEEIFRLGLSSLGSNGDPAIKGRLLAARGYWLWSFHRESDPPPKLAAEVVSAGEEAARLAQRLNDPALESVALDGLQLAFVRVGDMGRALEVTPRRRGLAIRMTDTREQADLFADCSWVGLLTGRYREAAEDAERGAEVVRGRDPDFVMNALSWLVLARHRLGEWSKCLLAQEELDELILEHRGGSDPPYAARQLGLIAQIQHLQGDRESAQKTIERARAVDRSMSRPALELYPALAWGLLAAREATAARTLLEPHLERAAILPAPGLLEAWCDVLAEVGDWDGVEAAAAGARRLSEARGLPGPQLFALRSEGRSALFGGNRELAARALAQAADGFAQLEARWEEALTRRELADLLASDDAAVQLERAEALFAELGIELARTDL